MTSPQGWGSLRGAVMDPRDAFRAAILIVLGYAPDVIEPGRLHRFATSDKRGDLAGWCRLFTDLHGGAFGCHRLGISETWWATDHGAMTHERGGEQARHAAAAEVERQRQHRQQRQQWAENRRRIEELWSQCGPLVPGDPVTLYLKRRGFAGVWPLPRCLRYAPKLTYWHDDGTTSIHAGMVAPLVAPDGRPVALHRTYLTCDGRKADVSQVRKLTRTAGPIAGACIPLHKPADGLIGIAEGIETSLAAWLGSGVPTVAAYSAGSMAAWQWPAGVQRVVIFADNDEAGRAAANKLRARVLAAGPACNAVTPSEPGADWCDVWAARAVIDGAAA